jgi:hypothetical protein
MWTEGDFASDLSKLTSKSTVPMAYTQFPDPVDPFLAYRRNLVQLLGPYILGAKKETVQFASAFLAPMIEHITNFDESYLTARKPSPPFDLLLLTFLNAVADQPPTIHLTQLFQHYQRVKRMIISQSADRVFLNDRIHTSEIEMAKEESLKIVQSRIDYLAELITTLIYNDSDHQLLRAFLTQFCPPSVPESEQTLSHIGRIIVASGEAVTAARYFERVQQTELKTANAGYIAVFEDRMEDAQRLFHEAGASAPANADAFFIGRTSVKEHSKRTTCE